MWYLCYILENFSDVTLVKPLCGEPVLIEPLAVLNRITLSDFVAMKSSDVTSVCSSSNL